MSDAAEALEPEDYSIHLKTLLSRLKVKKVVLVDDAALQELTSGTIFKTLSDNPKSSEGLQKFFPGIDLKTDNVNLQDQISAILNSCDATAQEEIRLVIQKEPDNATDKDDLNNLKSLLPDEIDFTFLQPQEWAEQQQTLISQCTPDELTLFLFDQQLNVEGEGLGFESGSDIIKEIAGNEPGGFGVRWFCGMLSNTLDKGTEVETWQNLAEEHSIGPQFFMPIAKENLSEAEDFFRALYRTLINTYCERMKDSAKEGFRASLDAAFKQFSVLDPIDFEHMVVKSSDTEGVSELETMLRIYSIFHRDEMKTEFLKQAKFAEFSRATTAIKLVADTHREMPSETKQRLLKLRSAEIYENDGLINSYHDPLRNGDLFELEKDGDRKFFVLIAQPCDVMVRSKGKRSREKNFKVAVLVPVEISDKKRENSASPTELGFELTHFGAGGDKFGFVNFTQAAIANLHVLDLAVLNTKGHCEVDPEGMKSELPKIPTRAWGNRIQGLVKHFEGIKTQIENARKSHKNGDEVAKLLIDALLPRAAIGQVFRNVGTYDKGKFTYPLHRKGRVRDPLAASLLSAFSGYLGRDAFDHDFSG